MHFFGKRLPVREQIPYFAWSLVRAARGDPGRVSEAIHRTWMSVVLGRRPGHCLPILRFDARHVPGFQVVQVLERPALRVCIVRLPISYVLKLDRPPDNMPETFFECFSSIVHYGGPVSQHLLEPGRAVAQPPEDEMVDPQKLESQVPPFGLARPDHVYRERLHIGVDSQCNVAAGSVPMRQVSVFMSQDGAEGVLAETVKVGDSQQEDTT